MDLSRFEELFKNHHDKLCNLSYKIVGEKDAAEDLVQELFIKLWDKRDTLTIHEFGGYLSKSIVNSSLNYLKSAKSRRAMMTMDVVPDMGEEVTEEQLKVNELQAKIDLAIRKLPAKCQTIFALSRFENMSSREIANQLGLSVKTVDNQIGIALSKLREELKPYLLLSVVILWLLYLLFLWLNS